MVSSYGGADKVPISKDLVLRARKSNAAYKEDLRKAEEEEKARLATREREKEEAARKKAAEANTEKWEKKVQDLQGKIKAKKAFIEEQNIEGLSGGSKNQIHFLGHCPERKINPKE